MTDPMPYRCPAIEPGMGVLERCILNVGHGGGFHMAAGAWPVEGSTPRQDAEQVATPPRCVHQIYTGSGWCVRCELKVGHEAPHTNGMMSWLHNDPRRIEDAPGSTPLDSPAPNRCPSCDAPEPRLHPATQAEGEVTRICPDAYHGAGEVVSPPDMRSRRQGGRGAVAQAGQPAPVPPPVDALLKLLDEYSDEIEYGTAAESACDSHTSALYGVAAKETRDSINRAINALWATGVEEGRRQRADEVERLQVLLDHAEQYARDLQDNGDVPGSAEVEYAVRVDRLHPTRTDKVGDLLTHLGEEKSRLCHQIWDGWTPVRRSVGPWEEFEDHG